MNRTIYRGERKSLFLKRKAPKGEKVPCAQHINFEIEMAHEQSEGKTHERDRHGNPEEGFLASKRGSKREGWEGEQGYGGGGGGGGWGYWNQKKKKKSKRFLA